MASFLDRKMNSANNLVEKPACTERELVNATYLPISIPSTTLELKAKEDELRSVKMARIQHLCFAILLLAILTITLVTAAPGNQVPAPAEKKTFQELLASVEPSALHNILHEHLKDKYQHGIYEKDKTAMEVLHNQNAEVASSLVELAKRQIMPSNGTLSSTSVVIATPTVSITSSPVKTPISQTPTPSNTPTPTPGQTPTETPPTTSSQPSTPTTTPSSSIPAKPTSETTSPASNPTSPESSRSPPSITQSIVYTTTLANGGTTTVTQITVVNADQAASQGNAGPGTKSNTANASLQTDGASTMSHQVGLSMCVGIVVAVACAL